jgi:hypothetical protein
MPERGIGIGFDRQVSGRDAGHGLGAAFGGSTQARFAGSRTVVLRGKIANLRENSAGQDATEHERKVPGSDKSQPGTREHGVEDNP